jgi:hypothetical protein
VTTRNALVDISALSLVDAEVISYLEPPAETIPKQVSAKPAAIDNHDDASIDTAKWDTLGTVVEQAFLGVNGLTITGPGSPGYDQAGVIYKPAIAAVTGKLVLSRFIMEHPVEYVVALQEYDFTVDNVVTPTTWDLKHTPAQDLRNSMGLKVAPGALYFFEGGELGVEEKILGLPSTPSETGKIYPIQVGFIFTATGWDIYVHLIGLWDAPQLVKSYVRPGSSHNADGYSLCVNVHTADDDLHFYNMANNFKSNAQVNGGRIMAAGVGDSVIISSLELEEGVGLLMGKTGSINVRIPDYSSSLLTLEEISQVTEKLTGKQVYPIEFELNGDASILHPVRISIEDIGLPEEASVEGE